jgi:hypothetical protein
LVEEISPKSMPLGRSSELQTGCGHTANGYAAESIAAAGLNKDRKSAKMKPLGQLRCLSVGALVFRRYTARLVTTREVFLLK